MSKYKVIVFGDLPIATKVVIDLKKMQDIDLVGVVVGNNNPNNNDPWFDIPCLFEYAKNNDVPVLKLEELPTMFEINEIDLGLSCRFSRIIKSNIISLFNKGIVNMHGGLLPEFGGLYSANYSILFKSKIGGGTLHYIDKGIDTGDILRRCEFEITDDDTGLTVFQKTQEALFKNLIEIIPSVLDGSIKSKPISEYVKKGYPSRYFNKNSILEYKKISKQELEDGSFIYKVRAFDFGDYEPAYIKVNDKKVYLRMR